MYPAVPFEAPLTITSCPVGRWMNCPMVRPTLIVSSLTYSALLLKVPSAASGVMEEQSVEASMSRI